MPKSHSTLVFSPGEHNVDYIDQVLRYVIGLETLAVVIARLLPLPQLIFFFSVIGFYLVMTAMTGFDPIYRALQFSSVPVSAVRDKERFWRGFLSQRQSKNALSGIRVLPVE